MVIYAAVVTLETNYWRPSIAQLIINTYSLSLVKRCRQFGHKYSPKYSAIQLVQILVICSTNLSIYVSGGHLPFIFTWAEMDFFNKTFPGEAWTALANDK